MKKAGVFLKKICKILPFEEIHLFDPEKLWKI